MPALHVLEEGVGLVERGEKRVGHALLRLGLGGQLAEQALAAVHAAEYVLHGVGDLDEVVHQVFARRDQLIDVGLPLRRDDRARLEHCELRVARGDVDVAVAGQETELLEPRAGIGPDALAVLAIDHQGDLHVRLLRVARERDVFDHADGHAGKSDRIALSQSLHAVEASLVLIFPGEDLLLRPYEKDKNHQHHER